MAQDGLQGLHFRAGLDRKRGVGVAQRVNDQSFNILHAGITQGRRPYAIPPVGSGLPATSRSTQQIILSTLVLQQSLDHGQQLAGYGNEPGPVPLRKGFDQVRVGIDRLGTKHVKPVPAQIHVSTSQGQGFTDT